MLPRSSQSRWCSSFTQTLKLLTQRHLKILDAFVNKTPLTPNIEPEHLRLAYEKNCRNPTTPSVANLKIDIRICIAKIRYEQRACIDSFPHPLKDIASEGRLICTLAQETGIPYCTLDTVVVDVVHVFFERHRYEDMRFCIRPVSRRAKALLSCFGNVYHGGWLPLTARDEFVQDFCEPFTPSTVALNHRDFIELTRTVPALDRIQESRDLGFEGFDLI